MTTVPGYIQMPGSQLSTAAHLTPPQPHGERRQQRDRCGGDRENATHYEARRIFGWRAKGMNHPISKPYGMPSETRLIVAKKREKLRTM
jgi:hypothetical protein